MRIAFTSSCTADVMSGASSPPPPCPPKTLHRILDAAHAAPRVGLSQPWDFVLIRDLRTRREFREHGLRERATFAHQLDHQQAATFSRITVEGALESSSGVVVTYHPQRGAPAILGRPAIAETGLYSVCLAIENPWLAATAEGLRMGWGSFYQEEFLRELLHIPPRIRPLAWLCLGPIRHLHTTPDLERHSWRHHTPPEKVLHEQ